MRSICGMFYTGNTWKTWIKVQQVCPLSSQYLVVCHSRSFGWKSHDYMEREVSHMGCALSQDVQHVQRQTHVRQTPVGFWVSLPVSTLLLWHTGTPAEFRVPWREDSRSGTLRKCSINTDFFVYLCVKGCSTAKEHLYGPAFWEAL